MAHHESNLLEADRTVRIAWSSSGSPCEAGSSESACPAGCVNCLKALPLWADTLSQVWHLHTGHSEGSGGGKPWSQLHSRSVCLLHAVYKMALGVVWVPKKDGSGYLGNILAIKSVGFIKQKAQLRVEGHHPMH